MDGIRHAATEGPDRAFQDQKQFADNDPHTDLAPPSVSGSRAKPRGT